MDFNLILFGVYRRDVIHICYSLLPANHTLEPNVPQRSARGISELSTRKFRSGRKEAPLCFR